MVTVIAERRPWTALPDAGAHRHLLMGGLVGVARLRGRRRATRVRRGLMLATLLAATGCARPAPEQRWSPAPGLKTRWAAQVDPARPLAEYPRPQMARTLWANLNSLWELAVAPDSQAPPSVFPYTILVPFPVESALGGVARRVSPSDRVWYRAPSPSPMPARAHAGSSTSTPWTGRRRCS
jgi:hypothetical protein